MLRAGKLRDRVTLQTPTWVTSATGEQSVTWADVATLPAKVTPLSASETLRAERLESQQRLIVELRYRSDVTPAKRFKHSKATWSTDRFYNITAVIDRDSRQRVLDVVCTFDATEVT